jgi:hypothetical protein
MFDAPLMQRRESREASASTYSPTRSSDTLVMHMARLAGLDRDDTPVVLVAEEYSEAGVKRGLGRRVGVGEEPDLVVDGVGHAPNLVRCDRASRVARGEHAFGGAAFALNVTDPSGDDGRVRARSSSG